MDPKLSKEFNKQINEEFFSAYLYLAMSAKVAEMGFDGIANWFFVQFQEEMDHGKGFFNYLQLRDEKIELEAIAVPKVDPKTELAEMFTETLKHEKHITSRIHLLYKMAIELNDFAAVEFLRWYVSEQVEEESNATKLLDRIGKVKNVPGAVYMMDSELAGRAYKPSDPVNPGA